MRLKSILILALGFISFVLQAQTDGSVTFTIKTIAKPGSFSPKHVYACWVENNSGTHIKNLEVDAANRIQYLYTWNASSGGVKSDITSGSTLASHVTHTKVWNCRNKAGILVPDGTYKILTEFTSEHAQGPLNTVSFTKSATAITLNPAASTYFSNINLVYNPLTVGIELQEPDNYELEVYPNPVKKELNVSFVLKAPAVVNLSIYNMNMQLVKVLREESAVAGKSSVRLAIPENLSAGNYILILQSDRFIATRKIVLSE